MEKLNDVPKWVVDVSAANTLREVAKRSEVTDPEKAKELHRQASELYRDASEGVSGYQKSRMLELSNEEANFANQKR
ncbi:MAG: hypothetical protein ACP5TK_00420 [Candidatus Micrarchaeia archaeon]